MDRASAFALEGLRMQKSLDCFRMALAEFAATFTVKTTILIVLSSMLRKPLISANF